MNDLIATIPFGGGELKIFTGKPPPLASNAAEAVWDDVLVAPAPDMAVVSSPLAGGLVAFDKSLLDFTATMESYKARTEAFSAIADTHSHMLDALRYGFVAGTIQHPGAYPEPPPTPPGLTPDQHAAHLMLHDLVSVEEFEVLREEPGFVQVNAHWGAIGKRKFCCEKPRQLMPGEVGFVDAGFYFSSVKLNEMWMASVETEAAPVRRSAWEKLKGWLKS